MCPGFERDRGRVAYRRQTTTFLSLAGRTAIPKSGRNFCTSSFSRNGDIWVDC
jgi:hypothetical protein